MASGSSSGDGDKSSGTAYSQVIADSQATVTFATAFNDLLGRPISALLSKQSAAAEYRVKLGEWASEAIDSHGRWLQPMLRVKAFEAHLVSEEGCPKPSGSCDASLAWAQLLFALNIRPGMGVLAWKQPPKAIKPGVDEMRLIVDGAVMCHIVNLFRVYTDPMPSDFALSNDNELPNGFTIFSTPNSSSCTFPFGTMSVDMESTRPPRTFPFGTMSINTEPTRRPYGAKFIATFEPGSREDLKCEKFPFPCDAPWLQETRLNFEKSPLMAKYLLGVYNQVPVLDATGIGPVPAVDCSLKERCHYFLRSIELLQPSHQCEPCCQTSSPSLEDVYTAARRHVCMVKADRRKPRVVTRAWLQDVERIKRRVTTNGGNDNGLLDFLLQSLKERASFATRMEQPMGEDCYALIREKLESKMLFTDQEIKLRWSEEKTSVPFTSFNTWPRIREAVFAAIPSILAAVSEDSKSSWLYKLSEVKDEVKDILMTDNCFLNKPVLVLELGPSHLFWNATFEIKGE